MTEHILVTGGAGFIGARLSSRLVAEGYQVSILDNMLPQVHGNNPATTSVSLATVPTSVNVIECNIEDIGHHQSLVDEVSAVYHLASETGTGQSMYEMGRYTTTNVVGTASLLESIAKRPAPLPRFVLTSSRSVYGEGRYECTTHGVQFPLGRIENRFNEKIFDPLCRTCREPMLARPTEEQDHLNPLSVYAVTKLTQEQLVSVASRLCDFPATILRLQNVYGEGQSLANPYTGILSIFAGRILKGLPIEVFEDGLESRDFVHVSDVVSALFSSLQSKNQGSQILNVGTGEATSVVSLIEQLAEVLGRTADFSVSGVVREGDIRHNFSDGRLLSEALGVETNVSFAEGLSPYVDWLVSQPQPEDRYQQSLSELKERGLLK